MQTTVHLQTLPNDLSAYDHVIVAGFKKSMHAYINHQWGGEWTGCKEITDLMMQDISETAGGQNSAFMLGQKVTFLAQTTKVSRMNCVARPDELSKKLPGCIKADHRSLLILCPAEEEHVTALTTAVARAFPTFSCKQSAKIKSIDLAILCAQNSSQAPKSINESQIQDLQAYIHGVQQAALWVDTPPDRLNVIQMVENARQIAVQTNSDIDVFTGETLQQMGMGGLTAVGQAAMQEPACVVLRGPRSSSDSGQMVWVGKGIMYDTGGLSLKPKTGMGGMKMDMGGAAAVLSAFDTAAKRGLHQDVCAILCLAENAIGPSAVRNDDIITLYSGKTVEINNTDAEGRLVLGDGVAYATQHLNADVVIDMATLTGAQLMSTGKMHAAIVCNDEMLERHAVELGRACGDLVHPLPYCPEFLSPEFKSEVADMKNSVKDRMNAQSSCAGHFVEAHLSSEGRAYQGQWLHVDIAGPAWRKERGTGYGVALLNALAESWQKDWV